MASSTVAYGRNLVLKIGGVTIGNLDNSGLTQSRDSRETTTKDSADEEEVVPTIKRRNLPFSGKFTETAAAGGGLVTLQAAYDNGTVLSWQLGETTPGTHKWTGSGFLLKYDIDAPFDGNVTFQGEIKPTGPITFGTN